MVTEWVAPRVFQLSQEYPLQGKTWEIFKIKKIIMPPTNHLNI